MKTFALKTRKRSVVKTMSSKSAKQQKALEQARSKLEDLTRKDVVSFSFILSEEGVELCGEEQLTVDMMNLLEESGMIEVAQRIRMHGQVLHHRSTRQIKIEKLQDAFDTRLPPTLYPLQNMKDYDLLRSLLNDVLKVEGLGRMWQPGDNPPESVQHWWGPDDWDLFRMYRNKDIPNELMELVKSRYMVHKKNGMGFFKQKLISCYKLRVGEELVNKFNMQTSMAEIEQVKEARLARLEDERRQRQAAQEED